MTRDEWLECEDPAAMLAFMTTRSAHVGHPGMPFASDRKLGLFGSHLLRLMCGGKDAFADAAEAFADGTSDRRALRQAWRGILADDGSAAPEHPAEWPAALLRDAGGGSWLAGEAADLLREIIGDPFAPVTLPGALPRRRCQSCHAPLLMEANHHHGLGLWRCSKDRRHGTGQVTLDEMRLHKHGGCFWRTPTVLSVAQATYDERQSDGTLDSLRLAVLRDCLLDAGCDCAPLLDHLADAVPHVRGCWVVDLTLGKE